MSLDPSTAEGQVQMYLDSRNRMFTICRTFVEIQTGPNPLTPDEVRRLIDRRPAQYGVLEANATPRSAA